MKPWLIEFNDRQTRTIVSVLPLRLSTQSYHRVGGRLRDDDAHVCSTINLTMPVVKSLSNQLQKKKRSRYAVGNQHIQKRIFRVSSDNVRYNL